MLDIVIIFSILIKEKTDHYYRNYFFLHISFQLKRIPHFNIRQQRVSVLEVKYSTVQEQLLLLGICYTEDAEFGRGVWSFNGELYCYFKNKDDHFLNLIGDIHENSFQSSRAGHHDFATDLYGTLMKSNKGYLSHYSEYRDFMRVLMEAVSADVRFRDFWWQMRNRQGALSMHSKIARDLADQRNPHPNLYRVSGFDVRTERLYMVCPGGIEH